MYGTATNELTDIRLESATIAMAKEGRDGRDEYSISTKEAEEGGGGGGGTYL